MDEKMDGLEKTAVWIISVILIFIAVVLGVGIWAVVELINWITSK